MAKKEDLVYPELSYKIIGLMFDVHNNLGGGLREKAYQEAVKIALEKADLKYREQINCPIMFKDKKVGNRFLDLLVDDKVILELKTGERFGKENIKQISEYLKTSNLQLGILVNFGKETVNFKRIVNLNS